MFDPDAQHRSSGHFHFPKTMNAFTHQRGKEGDVFKRARDIQYDATRQHGLSDFYANQEQISTSTVYTQDATYE
jgi:hypothetical protein